MVTTTYEDLVGKRVVDPKAPSYRPVAALFAMTTLLALATSCNAVTVRALEWFIGFSMVVLALLKVQNVESFATMFLNYDLLAKRWVPYSGRFAVRGVNLAVDAVKFSDTTNDASAGSGSRVSADRFYVRTTVSDLWRFTEQNSQRTTNPELRMRSARCLCQAISVS